MTPKFQFIAMESPIVIMHQSYQSCRSSQPTAEDTDTRSCYPGRYMFPPEHRDWRHTRPCLQSNPKESSLHNHNKTSCTGNLQAAVLNTRFAQSKTVSSLNHLWGRCAKWIHMNRILLHRKWAVAFHIKTLKRCDYVVGGGQQNQCKLRQGTHQETDTNNREKPKCVGERKRAPLTSHCRTINPKSSRVASERISCPILALLMLVRITREHRDTAGHSGAKRSNEKKAADNPFSMFTIGDK